jgi:hypothetical protein
LIKWRGANAIGCKKITRSGSGRMNRTVDIYKRA